MAQEIEVSLRIPNMKVRTLDENGYPIDHSTIRFKRIVQVPAIPKVGQFLQLSASEKTLKASVVGVVWSDDRGMFVVACQYTNRSIPADDHSALTRDPDWRMTPLI
jgi:hypothetical protein